MTLFKKINQHPTIFEQVSGKVKVAKQPAQSQLQRATEAKRPKTAPKMEDSTPHSSDTPHPAGALLGWDDVKPALKGRYAEVRGAELPAFYCRWWQPHTVQLRSL